MQHTPPSPPAPVRFTSLRKTLFVETSILLIFVVAITAISAFFLAKSEMDNRTFAQLQSIVHAKEDYLEGIVSRQREQVAALAKEPTIAAASQLIGFHDLVRIDGDNARAMIGKLPSSDELNQIVAATTTRHTAFVPIMSQAGWKTYAISTPAMGSGRLVAIFDTSSLIKDLLSAEYLGKTANVSLGVRLGDELVLLHSLRSASGTTAAPLYLGSLQDKRIQRLALAKAVQGIEGSDRGRDYAGVFVFSAYRTLPSIGWGIVVQIDRFEVLAPVVELGVKIGLLGVILVLLLSSIMFSLSRRIAKPLTQLTTKLRGLEARRWHFDRSIFTHDEIEEVDIAAVDLTKRLRESHDHLEEIVRQRTQALMEEHAQDDAIFESIEYGLLVTNINGEIVSMNKSAERMTGWTEPEVCGAPFEKVLSMHDKDCHPIERAKHPLQTVLDTKRTYAPATDQHLSLVQKDGKTMPLTLRVTPILRGTHCSGTVTVFADITEARRLDKLKSEFISLVSHQLRTPLTAIRWYLEMLLSKDTGPLNAEQQNLIRDTSESNERMVRLVNALLNVSRIELGKFALNVEAISLPQFVEQVMKGYELEMQQKNLAVKFEVGEKDLLIYSDPVLLRLVVENLCSNAMKYSPQSATITVATKRVGETGAAIEVTDHGIGIPANQQRHIFEKMFRGTNAQVVDTNGNGLGLYISNIATQTIGASLSFTSTEGKGTTFTITLPQRPEASMEQDHS